MKNKKPTNKEIVAKVEMLTRVNNTLVEMIDNVGDVINENSNSGTDSAQSSVSYTLSANVENLTLTVSLGFSSVYNLLSEPLGFFPVPFFGSAIDNSF